MRGYNAVLVIGMISLLVLNLSFHVPAQILAQDIQNGPTLDKIVFNLIGRDDQLVQDLIDNELDVIGLLNTRVVSLGRYGRTKKIRLGITRSFITKVFVNDNRLGHLIHYTPQCSVRISGSKN